MTLRAIRNVARVCVALTIALVWGLSVSGEFYAY